MNRSMNKLLGVCTAVAVLLLVSGPAQGAPIVDKFSVAFWADGGYMNINEGEYGNTGYNDGAWYEYPSGWFAQWYYDHPFDDTRWKQIHIVGQITGQNDNTYGAVAVNWSTPVWSLKIPHPTTPPLPPLSGAQESMYIQRQVILPYGKLDMLDPIPIDMYVDVPDYNPEWVSIDVMCGSGGGGYQGTILFNGTISHECIPEPATMSLLALGGLALLKRKCG